ncbi:MAG TPA: metallopeptidase TldD-related protein [Clostridia bacterium]|nr:metallopeptidase TldD-related protein [Clostridia bacterium]
MRPQDVIAKLRELREYALTQKAKAQILWSAEDSHMVRYANSAISLNSDEKLTRLAVTVYGDHKQASTGLIVDYDDMETMKTAIDKAVAMLPFASPMTYEPTLASIAETSISQASYDPKIESLSNEEIITFVNQATVGLETDDILLSGNFSAGVAESAAISTETPEVVYWRSSDIGITLVLASEKRKWEANAEQFVYRKSDLDAGSLYDRLSWLVDLYNTRPEVRLPEGPYRVVLGPAAIAEYLGFLGWVGYSGGYVKRGFGMFKADDVGQKVMSKDFTLMEDPSLRETFGMPVDRYGRQREKRAIFDQGVLTGFLWDQQAADEFSEQATGHDVANLSIELVGGDVDVTSIQAFAELPRGQDILYVPFLHYANIVNPGEGLVTGISRFGALYLKQDGTIQLPYNVRFTERLNKLFGDKLVWLAKETIPYGSSTHYFGRDPSATLVPALACFDGVNVEISNESF